MYHRVACNVSFVSGPHGFAGEASVPIHLRRPRPAERFWPSGWIPRAQALPEKRTWPCYTGIRVQ